MSTAPHSKWKARLNFLVLLKVSRKGMACFQYNQNWHASTFTSAWLLPDRSVSGLAPSLVFWVEEAILSVLSMTTMSEDEFEPMLYWFSSTKSIPNILKAYIHISRKLQTKFLWFHENWYWTGRGYLNVNRSLSPFSKMTASKVWSNGKREIITTSPFVSLDFQKRWTDVFWQVGSTLH